MIPLFRSITSKAGYFIQDNSVINTGLGYLGSDGSLSFTYKLTGRKYTTEVVPLSGASIENANSQPLCPVLQDGYAFFFYDIVSIESSLHNTISLDEDFNEDGFFEWKI